MFDVPSHKANPLETTTSFVRPSLGLCPLNAIQEDPRVGKAVHSFFVLAEICIHKKIIENRLYIIFSFQYFCFFAVMVLFTCACLPYQHYPAVGRVARHVVMVTTGKPSLVVDCRPGPLLEISGAH